MTATKTIVRGFTLFEMLAVIVILGIIAAIIAPRFLGGGEAARRKATGITLQTVKSAIELYQFETGKYPESFQDLLNKKYIKEKDTVDAWGEPFTYKRTPGAAQKFELYSYGSSEGPDTPPEQRISVWDL